jgi:G3E family GTPase
VTASPPVQVNLLFGFLGAGKTTLVRRLLSERADGLKTAVIVNEFGEVGVDGQILSGSNVDILELTSGCLCCTLKGSLILAIEELRDLQKVERVIVEATGVAQPAEMKEALAEPTEGPAFDIGPVVTVVDTAKLPKLLPMLGEFYASQIENADIVVLNKSDLVAPEAMEAASRQIRELNPRADILFAEQGDIESAYLLRPRPGMKSGNVGVATAPEDYRYRAARGHHDAPPAESFVIESTAASLRQPVEQFFHSLGDDVWRAKGYLAIGGESCLVQYAMGQLEITPAEARSKGYIVFIGRGMDRARIEQRFRLAEQPEEVQ